jgi:hypothetical protein
MRTAEAGLIAGGLLLLLASGCNNTLHTTTTPNPWSDTGAVTSGQTLVWTDLRTAALNCGEAFLRSAWDQLFPVPANDPGSSVNAQVTRGEVRGRSSTRGVSVGALDEEIGIDGFGALSVTDASEGPSPDSKTIISITHAGQVRNVQFGPKLFPRLIALFSPEDVARRGTDINTPGAMDVIVGLHYIDTTQKQVQLRITPPIDGVASTFTANVGDYSTCLRQALKISAFQP